LKHFATPSFWLHYRQLPPDVQDLADKKFALMKEEPRHPSLRLKTGCSQGPSEPKRILPAPARGRERVHRHLPRRTAAGRLRHLARGVPGEAHEALRDLELPVFRAHAFQLEAEDAPV